MTDQDHDGSHIKGLIMNYFHTFYPSLMKLPGFLIEFITPVIKVNSSKYGTPDITALGLSLRKFNVSITASQLVATLRMLLLCLCQASKQVMHNLR